MTSSWQEWIQPAIHWSRFSNASRARRSAGAHRSKLLSETLPKHSKLLDEAAAEYNKVTADKAATKDQKDAAYKKWVAAYDAYKKEAGDPYHALPEEADAWAVAGKMKTAYTKK